MARYAALSSSLLPLSPDDLYEFRFLTDAQISPDGGRIAYSVRTANANRDGYQGAIWLVSSDGEKEPAQITAGTSQDSTPQWSPEGDRLAFTSDRGDVPKGKSVRRATSSSSTSREARLGSSPGYSMTAPISRGRQTGGRSRSSFAIRKTPPTRTTSYGCTPARGTSRTRADSSMTATSTSGSSVRTVRRRGD